MELEAKLEEPDGPAGTGNKSKVAAGMDGGNKQVESDELGEDVLVPLKVGKSVSLPVARQPHQGVKQSTADASIQLIKSLMALLTESESPKQPALQERAHSSAGQGQSPQLMPQVWSLVLKSFTTVSVSRLVEARIVDTLIKAFLRAPEDIQQSTFP
jgi:hypothetical protein